MKAAVILAGSGVYDGSEIHESVFALLALEENGVDYQCYAPNKSQYHVVNHITGEEMDETRNVLVESARIARGSVVDLKELTADGADLLVIPGGFGVAKNLNQWAISGSDGELDSEVKRVINDFTKAKKPICGLCMGPTVIAQALSGSGIEASLTVGTSAEPTPYEIDAISEGMESLGAVTVAKTIEEIAIDQTNKIVTAPCYMMEASPLQVRNNIAQAIKATVELI
ncbi:isoprenoid biosynthesis glyoxalase ElbB [Reichenbachiella versicolor]|uniref:isoprenoid biosynthesis glyoxalase ElbB n=1 Tax=Reichenbachiella versicolor TaxID=1821036 RepID=UPI000D6E5E49|nr:isoprenoid biosynthesis glyoxalase ElbB [Reichenbachiella versicolor]